MLPSAALETEHVVFEAVLGNICVYMCMYIYICDYLYIIPECYLYMCVQTHMCTYVWIDVYI